MNQTQALDSGSSKRAHKYFLTKLGHPSLAPDGIQTWLVSLKFHLLAGPEIPVLLVKSELASRGLLLPPIWPPKDQSCGELVPMSKTG